MFLNQKRKLSEFLNEDEFIDINNFSIPCIPFIVYSNLHFDYEPPQQQPKNEPSNTNTNNNSLQNENLICKQISPCTDCISLDDIPLNTLSKQFPERKLNIILDIDQTLIYSKDLEKFNETSKSLITNECHQIKVKVQSKIYEFVLNLRSHVKNFLQSISKYSTFYICTLSHEKYANEIVNILRNIANIEINDDNIIAVGAFSNYKPFYKSISLFKNITNYKKMIQTSAPNFWYNKGAVQ